MRVLQGGSGGGGGRGRSGRRSGWAPCQDSVPPKGEGDLPWRTPTATSRLGKATGESRVTPGRPLSLRKQSFAKAVPGRAGRGRPAALPRATVVLLGVC